MPQRRFEIIGAGPALSAGCEPVQNGREAVVLVRDPRHVGGLARTVECGGFRFDIGAHHFFSKNPEIDAMWSGLMAARNIVGSFDLWHVNSDAAYFESESDDAAEGGRIQPSPLVQAREALVLAPIDLASLSKDA